MILDLQASEVFVKTTLFTQAKDLIPLFEKKFGYHIGHHLILKAPNKMGWTRKKEFSLQTSLQVKPCCI